MKKEKIKNILLIVIVALVTSFVTAYGVSSTFDSSNVCYKVDSNTGASVQDTIDDLYGRASDYSTLNNKLDGYFKNNPTSYFDGNSLSLGINAPNSTQTGLEVYYNGERKGGLYSTSVGIAVGSRDSSNWGAGRVNIDGNPVAINGEDIILKQYTLTLNGATIYFYRVGGIVSAVIASDSQITLASKTWYSFATKTADFPSFRFLTIPLINGNTLILRIWGSSIDYYYSGTSPAYLQGSGSTIVS